MFTLFNILLQNSLKCVIFGYLYSKNSPLINTLSVKMSRGVVENIQQVQKSEVALSSQHREVADKFTKNKINGSYFINMFSFNQYVILILKLLCIRVKQ